MNKLKLLLMRWNIFGLTYLDDLGALQTFGPVYTCKPRAGGYSRPEKIVAVGLDLT